MKPYNFPTDNLYKFIALGGLFFLIWSLTISIFSVITYKEKFENIKFNITSYETEFNKLSTAIQSYQDTNKLIEKSEIDQLKISLDQKVNDFNKEIFEFIKLKNNFDSFQVFLWLLVIISFISAFATAWGFVMWYHKLQKLLDAKLYLEVMKINKKMN